jgi:hypothetical protein
LKRDCDIGAEISREHDRFGPDIPGKNEAWRAPFDALIPNVTPIYNEMYPSYFIYNWELAFHVPMALADKPLEMQQFDLALKMCHFFFHPYD